MISHANDDVSLSIVIPVYNERESLPLLVERLNKTLAIMDISHELVFVDDGSTDNSDEILEKLCQSQANIRLAVLRRNFGKSGALAVGFVLARGQSVITMDADLQDDPAEMPRLLSRLEEGYDVVTGAKENRQDSLLKIFASRIANWATGLLTGITLLDMNSGYKCYRAEVVKRLQLYGDLHRFIPVMAHYQGFRVAEIPVKHHARQFGRSKYGGSRYIRGLLDLLTVIFLSRFRYRPLHLFGSVGLVLFILGILINGYLAVLWVGGQRPIGDRPLLMLGMLLTIIGVQILSFGLVAELLVATKIPGDNPLDDVRALYPRHDDDEGPLGN